MIARREFLSLGLAACCAAADQKPQDESISASATLDRTPRVGIVLSSFAGSTEHDGTPVKGLPEPRPVNADLTASQTGAMLGKALELGTLRRGGIETVVAPDDWVFLLPAEKASPVLIGALLEWLAEHKRGRRITVAGADYSEALLPLAARWKNVRFEVLDLKSCARLRAPSPVRMYAKGNADGVYSLPRAFRACDKLIAVAPLRTHPVLGVTLTAASYLGLAPAEEIRASGSLDDVMIDLFAQHPADYAIAGGSWGYEAEGERVHHNLLVAGPRAVAVDAVASAVMGFDPKKLAFIGKLERRGFGIGDIDSMWTRGNEIEEATRKFRRPAAWRES